MTASKEVNEKIKASQHRASWAGVQDKMNGFPRQTRGWGKFQSFYLKGYDSTSKVDETENPSKLTKAKIYEIGYEDGIHIHHMNEYYMTHPLWEIYMWGYNDGMRNTTSKSISKSDRNIMKKNPIGTAEELIARAHKEGLVDGKNHASKDSYYTKEAPRELKLSYLDGYSKGKRENPMKKNSTVRMNPLNPYFKRRKPIPTLQESEQANSAGYITGLTGIAPADARFLRSLDPTAFQNGLDQGMSESKTLQTKKKGNPQWLRDSGKPKRAAYSAFDAGYYDARTGGPGGKLDDNDEYNSGFSEGLKEFNRINSPKENPLLKRKNTHLQFEENPKLPKLSYTIDELDSMSDEELQTIQYERGYYAGSLNKPSHERLAGMYASFYRKGYDEGRADRVNNTVKNPKSKKQLPFRRFFPKIKPGRPAGGPKGGYWWILDIFDAKDRKLGHLIGKGTKEKATLDAKYKVGDKYRGKAIERAMLSGPYDRKPTAKTKRK